MSDCLTGTSAWTVPAGLVVWLLCNTTLCLTLVLTLFCCRDCAYISTLLPSVRVCFGTQQFVQKLETICTVIMQRQILITRETLLIDFNKIIKFYTIRSILSGIGGTVTVTLFFFTALFGAFVSLVQALLLSDLYIKVNISITRNMRRLIHSMVLNVVVLY